jgi:trehalose utilization protein
VLDDTDVLVWWSHTAVDLVLPEVTERVHDRILAGMGFIPLHSSMSSHIFRRLLGTRARIYFRNVGERERLWVIDPAHAIVRGVDRYIELDREEMYGEDFEIPAPDELVFVSWFEGGEVFRSGCCWRRGRGRIFYFRPGHESFPTYYNEDIQTVIYNACIWAAPPFPVAPNRDHVRVTQPVEPAEISDFRRTILMKSSGVSAAR